VHADAAVISSMTWLPGAEGLLAVIDSWGRLCLLTARALERLQLMDSVSYDIQTALHQLYLINCSVAEACIE